MKKRMAMIVFSLFFLCSCAPNTGQSGSGSQTEPPTGRYRFWEYAAAYR